jgi:sporulation protein YlmC with PRC-barrel domain
VADVDLDLVYHVLDMQILDVNGRRCGRVDDVEMELDSGLVTALLVGPGVFADRLPGRALRRLARRLTGPEVIGGNLIRVPWEDIDSIDTTVTLKRPAEELALGRGDAELSEVVSRILLVPERKPK